MVRDVAHLKHRRDFGNILHFPDSQEELGGSERGFRTGLEVSLEIKTNNTEASHSGLVHLS